MKIAPRKAGIATFPDTWFTSVQTERWQERNVNEYASRKDLQDWLEDRHEADSDPCMKMFEAVNDTLLALEEEDQAAHDLLNTKLYQIIALAQEGHSGVLGGLDEVERKFIEMVSEKRIKAAAASSDAGRTPRGREEARAEFLRSRDGAIRILMNELDLEMACFCVEDEDVPEEENAPGHYAEHNPPESYDNTDLGLAEHFVDLHKWDIVWLPEEENWIVWNGTTWERDLRGEMVHRAKRVGHRLRDAAMKMAEQAVALEEAGESEEAERIGYRAKDVMGAAKEAHQLPRIKRFLETARSEPGVTRLLSEFDERPELLGVANGVVELGDDGSASLRAGTRADRITRSTVVPYEADATSEELEGFLTTFIPDRAVRAYFQKFVGYSLFGQNKDRKIAFLLGKSSTGKSTILEALMAMMGSYGGPLPLSIFHANNSDRPRPDVIAAKPKRIITTSELDAKSPIHADQLKKLISTDAVSVRGMRSNTFDDRQHCFTPFIATNIVPSVPGADTAFRFRLAVFPFNVQLAPDDPRLDTNASTRFKTDPEFMTALLAWAVKGWGMYCKEGLADLPRAMEIEAEKFMGATNHFQDWFISTFQKAPGHPEITRDILDSYTNWCMEHDVPMNERLNTNRALPAALEDAGFIRDPKTHRIDGKVERVRLGYRFLTEREKARRQE